MKFWALSVAGLWAGDAVTTAIGLSMGATELNPLGPVLALTIKAGACALALAVVYWTRTTRLALAPMLVALAAPVAWNIAMLGGAS